MKNQKICYEKKMYKSYHYCCNVMENVWKATNDFFLDYIFIIFFLRERMRENWNFERWEWGCSTESVAQFWISQILIHCAFMRESKFLSREKNSLKTQKNSLNMKKFFLIYKTKIFFILSRTLLSHFSSSVFMFIFVWMKEKK
jgi:hypothetical protein